MDYFTATEAINIIRYTPVNLCTGFDDNPNREAFASVLEESCGRGEFVSMMNGFLLGFATGKRAERARRCGN